MEEALVRAAEYVVLAINAMALVIVFCGTVEAFVTAVRLFFKRPASPDAGRQAWLRYGRWLVAGLTVLLAADICETALAPTWDDIGKLGAIAVIRTFLNFFLERDMREIAAERPSAKGPTT